MRRQSIYLTALGAALAAGCLVETGDPVETVDQEVSGAFDEETFQEAIFLEDIDPLEGSDCTTAEECEVYLEQTLAQCLAACRAGPKAIEGFCRVIPHPAVRAACWGVVYGGPVVCSNFCYWYFTP